MKLNIKAIFKNQENMNILYERLKEFYYRFLFSDQRLIRKKFRERLNREVNLQNPSRLTDKLQWLKLNWYDPLATKCSDKYKVREFIADKIGKQYLNELIEVYEDVDEIDISKLPKSFVLKGTHGSGFNLICKDKYKMNWDQEFEKMRYWMRKNYHWEKREWVYKDIKPRIICEKYISQDNSDSSLIDYKFYCFNGRPTYCQVIRGRGENETIDFYDTNWNHMSFNGLREFPMSDITHEKPRKYQEMLSLAEILSKEFPFVRVDFYYVKSQIIFGELTFFPASGMGRFKPDEWDRKLGDLLKLPKNIDSQVEYEN